MQYRKFSESCPFYYDRRSYDEEHRAMTGAQHYHNFFEIYYIESGCCNYFIDNKSYYLEAGDLVLIPEGIIHNTLYWENKASSRILINCTRKYIPQSAEGVFAKRNYFYCNRDIRGKLLEILNVIGEEYNHPDAFCDEALKSYMALFFFMMARNKNEYNEQNSQSGGYFPDFV